jgi:hypothetical protein
MSNPITITKSKWLECVELRYKYECNHSGVVGEEYILKSQWLANGVDASPHPRCRSMCHDTVATQKRIDGLVGLASGQQTTNNASKSACHSCDSTGIFDSVYGLKNGSYERYLLKKRGTTIHR